ncbi:alpha-amylase 2 [Dionaea muscipula]
MSQISDADEYLERTFLSSASVTAGNTIRRWMEDAGLTTWVDHMGNIHGRVNGLDPSTPALLIGSHIDTVVDAGKFDGTLGVISAISALKVLKISKKLGRLRRPVEVIAFSDEEGVRFHSTFLGSAALAGTLPLSALNISDKSGRTIRDILKQSSIETTEESLIQLKYEPKSVWGYVELHIEQGPVLESLGVPLGVVKGIAGQTRLKVESWDRMPELRNLSNGRQKRALSSGQPFLDLTLVSQHGLEAVKSCWIRVYPQNSFQGIDSPLNPALLLLFLYFLPSDPDLVLLLLSHLSQDLHHLCH